MHPQILPADVDGGRRNSDSHPPEPFGSLSRRGQLIRLRRLANAALTRYGLSTSRLATLRHEHNTTFRIDAQGGTYVLRINRPGVYTAAMVASEMAWLKALRSETRLGVPEPVATRDGALVVVAEDGGVPEPRVCVLLRWQEGRFLDDQLTPVRLRAVAGLQAGLQQHALHWRPPDDFARPRVDTLTDAAKRESVVRTAALALPGEHPAPDDADRARRLVADLLSPAAGSVFARALDAVWAATHDLAAKPDAFGLIHADLHQENYLFSDEVARAIDFDDCGWGFHLYDLAVTLSELEGRPRYAEMSRALLEAYARGRPLPDRHEAYLAAFIALRRMQLITWILESRQHATFRDDWQPWAGKELLALSTAMDRR
jgi:Ser/Thr protein kinase RdoA (MazF antagonist)